MNDSTFQILGFIHFGISIFNLLASFLLFISSRSKLYKSFFLFWLIAIIALFFIASMSKVPVPFREWVLLVQLPQWYMLAYLLAKTLEIPVKWKNITYLIVSGIIVSIILQVLGVEYYPGFITIAAGVSLFYVSTQALLFHFKKVNLPAKGTIITMFLLGVHSMDPGFIYKIYPLTGFTLALILVLALSIFVPATVIENVTRENTRMQMEKKTIALLFNSSKFSALGEIAGGIAHEINNPLAIMQLKVENLKESISTHQNVFNEILAIIARISKVVKSLLYFSKETPVNTKVECPVKVIVDETFNLCGEKLRLHNIDVQIPEIPENIKVSGSPNELSHVLLNLVNNSFDAISTLHDNEKWIKVDVAQKNDTVDISITDSGKGIPVQNRQKLFQPFFSTKSEVKGIGVGLSVSLGIVQLHKGELFYDENSQNTKFTMRLPVA